MDYTTLAHNFITLLEGSRSASTATAYATAITYLLDAVDVIDERTPAVLAATIQRQGLAAATEALYCTAAMRFLEYLASEGVDINPAAARVRLKNVARRQPERLPTYDQDALDVVINHVLSLPPDENPRLTLLNLRDRALILTLADTGLRIHEALALNRDDIQDGAALVVGKGNRQAVVRFSTRAIEALNAYLQARPDSARPLFIRHDKAAKKPARITTKTGRQVMNRRALEAGQDPAAVHPHAFRHYFVTRAVRATDNMEIARRLARHANMNTTVRYTHLVAAELDAAYDKIYN